MGFFFQETQERFRNSPGKGAIRVRAMEVLLYFQVKQACHFHCCLPYKLGSSHKGKNLLP